MVCGGGSIVLVLILKLCPQYVCTCRIRQNPVQLQSKSEDYLSAIILNRLLFQYMSLCVCALPKNSSSSKHVVFHHM